MNQLELRQLRYFAVLAEERHFGRAAERLGIAQPPLSQQIQKIEWLVGHSLIRRRPHFALTPAGEAFLVEARATLAAARRLKPEADRAALGETGMLRIGFSTSALGTPLLDALRPFKLRYPEVAVELMEQDAGDQIVLLEGGKLDLAIVREPVVLAPGLKRVRAIPDELTLALHADHPLRKAPNVSLAMIADYDLLALDGRYSVAAMVDTLFRSEGLRPRPVQTFREWFSMLVAVDAGLGIALVPSNLVRIGFGRVVAVPVVPRIGLKLSACVREGAEAPIVDNFLRCLDESGAT